MKLIGIIILAIVTVDSVICLIDWYGGLIKEIINKDKKTNKAEDKVKELSKTFEIERSLNEVLNNLEINRLKQQILNNSEQDKHMKNNDKQIVYKIEKGDLVGDIKGDNIIVILMNGDVYGDISSKEGDVVLIKGDINGDVKANKVICPQQKSDYENYIDKLSSVEKLSKPDKEDEAHCICAKPNTNCAKCAWYDYVDQECKSWDVNEGECQFIDKYESKDKIKDSFRQPPPDYVDCADCAYGEIYSTTPNGCDYYKCSKFDEVMRSDGARICDSFKQKERHTCRSCYHFVKSSMYEDKYYCSKNNLLEILTDSNSCCQYYDSTGETTKHKIDCARASNNSGLCLFFCSYGCPIKDGCPHKVNRSEDG